MSTLQERMTEIQNVIIVFSDIVAKTADSRNPFSFWKKRILEYVN